jgi:hypothetical protein
MSYAQGGIIQASDYNTFVARSPAVLGDPGGLNTVWAVGRANFGYGQTAIPQINPASIVTAAQWASAVNTLNSISLHQTGSGTGIGPPTAGGIIQYLSTFSSKLSTLVTGAGTSSFFSQGTTQTGSVFSPPETFANGAAAQFFSITRTATFASADQARYFFNAGGQINFVITGVTNNDSTSRSDDMVTLIQTNFGGLTAFRAQTNGGRTGTGGTASATNTNFGYYNLTTSATNLGTITSTTSGYTGDYLQFFAQTNGTNLGGNSDAGNVISFNLFLYSAARSTLPAPPANPPGTGTTTTNTVVNDTINVTINHRIDVVYPETTNLTNTWGTVTIA